MARILKSGAHNFALKLKMNIRNWNAYRKSYLLRAFVFFLFWHSCYAKFHLIAFCWKSGYTVFFAHLVGWMKKKNPESTKARWMQESSPLSSPVRMHWLVLQQLIDCRFSSMIILQKLIQQSNFVEQRGLHTDWNSVVLTESDKFRSMCTQLKEELQSGKRKKN